MSRRRWQQSRLDDVIAAWEDYPEGARQVLMTEWPDLYFAVARLVRFEQVMREPS